MNCKISCFQSTNAQNLQRFETKISSFLSNWISIFTFILSPLYWNTDWHSLSKPWNIPQDFETLTFPSPYPPLTRQNPITHFPPHIKTRNRRYLNPYFGINNHKSIQDFLITCIQKKDRYLTTYWLIQKTRGNQN